MEFLGQPAPPKQPLSPASTASVNPELSSIASKSTVPLEAAALHTLVSQESALQESSVCPTSQSALACHGIPELGRLATGQENLVAETRSLSQRMDRLLNRTVTSCCAAADHDDITLRGVRETPRCDSGVLNGLGVALSSAMGEGKSMKCSHAKQGKKVRPAAVTAGAVLRTAMAAYVGILDLVRQSNRQIHRRGAGIKMSKRQNRFKILDLKPNSRSVDPFVKDAAAIPKFARKSSCGISAKLQGDVDSIDASQESGSKSTLSPGLESHRLRSVLSAQHELKFEVADQDAVAVCSKSASDNGQDVRFPTNQSDANWSGSGSPERLAVIPNSLIHQNLKLGETEICFVHKL